MRLNTIAPAGSRSPPTRYLRVASAPLAAPAAQGQDFVELVRKIWRHRWLVLVCTVIATVLSVGVALSLRSYYIAEAQVLIGVPEPRVFSTDQLMDPGGPDREKVDNERAAMMSRELAGKVAARIDAADSPEFAPPANAGPRGWRRFLPVRLLPTRILPAAWQAWLEKPPDTRTPASAPSQSAPSQSAPSQSATQSNAVIDTLLSRIDVTRVGRSAVLSIDARATGAGLAARLANAWAAVYLETKRDEKLATTNRVSSYLNDRITATRQQVASADQAVEDYRRQNALYRGTNANVTNEQLTELNAQLILAQTAKAEADAKLHEATSLQHGGSDSDPAVLGSQTIQMLKQQQATAEQHLAELQTTFGDKYPKVVKAQAEVADISRKLSAEINRTVSSVRQATQVADTRYATLQRNFQTLQSHMGEVGEKAIHLEALERDAAVNRNLLQALLSRAGEIIGRQELDQPDAKLVSSAAPPAKPGFPPRKLIVLLGAFAGLLAGIVGALIRDSADRTFRTADDVTAATGLPVIASVPAVSGRVPPAAHVLRRPVSSYAEALRKVYIGLLLSEAEQPPKTVLISSSVPEEGKSVLAASLARMLAWNGKRVLAIDCDWRAPSLHRVFHCPNKTGLAALMTEEQPSLQDLIFTDPASGVDVLVAGGWTPRAAHMMTSARMQRVVGTFANNYDLVILDGPPVLTGADVLPLARMADKTLFVLRWGHTGREAVRDAMRQLADANADVAGIVFARVDPKRYRQFSYGKLNYEYVRSSFA